MLRANRAAISVMLGRAAAGGLDMAMAVVIVVDQQDEVGRALADLAAERAGLDADDERARADARGDIPTAIMVADLRSAEALFDETHPSVASGLQRPPPDACVRVVVVAAGGAMLVHGEMAPPLAAALPKA